MAFIGLSSARYWSRALTGAVVVALAAPALAEDADRLTPPLVLYGNIGDGLWLYGQLDKGLLIYDDGATTLAYPLVDNANKTSRGGLWFTTEVVRGLNASINVEHEWTPYSTDTVNRLNRDEVDLESGTLRHAELILEVDDFGSLYVGQGSTASDFTSENDLSGTDMVTYASISDMAGGQLFVTDDGTISDIAVVDAFSDFDGLGRRLRVRYDTPAWRGLGLRASAGRDKLLGTGGDGVFEWDVVATYTLDSDLVQVASALAYSRRDGAFDRLNGSVSTLHVPTGLNLTVAGGADERDPTTNGAFLYGKLGWRADLIDAGKTSFTVDLYGGHDVESEGSESLSLALGAAQAVPRWQTTFYAGLRWHDFDNDAADYRSSLAFLTGALFRF